MVLFSYRSFVLSVVFFVVLFTLKSKYSKHPNLGNVYEVEITPQKEEEYNSKKNIQVLEITDMNKALNILEIAESVPSIKLTMIPDSIKLESINKHSTATCVQYIKNRKYYELD